MNEGADDFHFHALAEREPSDLRLHEFLDVQKLGHERDSFIVDLVRDLVDRFQELKCIGRRQIPPELGLLAHDE